MKEERHINNFPSEILLDIFWRLDDYSLLASELTCKRWKKEIENGRIYSKKCRKYLNLNPDLGPTYLQHQFEKKVEPSWIESKRFYFKLLRLNLCWERSPRVTVIDCMKVEVGDKKMTVSEDWSRRHNYSGFYDLVWLPKISLLVCSVYDTIQLWDMSRYRCIGLIGNNLIDDLEGLKSWCFYANEDTLFCGTNKGQIRLFDLATGSHVDTFRHPENMNLRNYISDVKVRDDNLLAVDWHGHVQHWKVVSDSRKLFFVTSFTPNPISPLTEQHYTSKQKERLIDFNEVVGVTTVGHLICVWREDDRHRRITWIRTETYVLCCKVFNAHVFWGEQNGCLYQFSEMEKYNKSESVHEVTEIKATDPDSQCGRVQTSFKDSITSVSVTPNRVAFGDKNGEIHIVSTPLGKASADRVLETGHQFGDFVWAIQVDGVRIFSGDSDGKLVIHDFWEFDGTSTNYELEDCSSESDQKTKKQKPTHSGVS